MRRFLIAGSALAVLTLAACGEASDDTVNIAATPPAPSMQFAANGAFHMDREDARQPLGLLSDSDVEGGLDNSTTATTAEQLEAAGTLLAYSYATSLQLPARNVRAAMTAHEAECQAAGPSICQVLSSSVNESGENYIYARLYVRAAPEWLASFRDGLEADARAADGRVTASNVSAEDLTRAITDTEARLRAKRTLRERLEVLLQNQSGDVGDLLQVERELARVQAELDSAQSNLEIMRRRVEMSTLNLDYSPTPVALSQSAFAPIGDAINEFVGVFSDALGFIIRSVAFLAPFGLVGVPFVWLLRRFWRNRRARKLAAKS